MQIFSWQNTFLCDVQESFNETFLSIFVRKSSLDVPAELLDEASKFDLPFREQLALKLLRVLFVRRVGLGLVGRNFDFNINLTKRLDDSFQDSFFLLRTLLKHEEEKFEVEQVCLERHASVRELLNQALDDCLLTEGVESVNFHEEISDAFELQFETFLRLFQEPVRPEPLQAVQTFLDGDGV